MLFRAVHEYRLVLRHSTVTTMKYCTKKTDRLQFHRNLNNPNDGQPEYRYNHSPCVRVISDYVEKFTKEFSLQKLKDSSTTARISLPTIHI